MTVDRDVTPAMGTPTRLGEAVATDIKTADLYDEFGERLQVCEPRLRDYGGHRDFYGYVETVRCREDNSRVRERLSEAGEGRVLVVDGGGSLHCALLGDRLAAMAVQNGWAGLVIHGCIRDTRELAGMSLGVKALAAIPRKSVRRGNGDTGVPVSFLGVHFHPGDLLYADEDGVAVLHRPDS